MKKRIDKYIPFALSAIRSAASGLLLDSSKPNDILEEYDGYAASFGPSVINSGLVTAISFYTDIHRSGDGENKARRFKMLKVISQILRQDGTPVPNQDNGLLEFIIRPGNDNTDNKAKIIDASIAVKLALRNFNHVKST